MRQGPACNSVGEGKPTLQYRRARDVTPLMLGGHPTCGSWCSRSVSANRRHAGSWRRSRSLADGILSRTIFQDDRIKAVLFGFGQGQELSEHTAAKPAMLLFVRGEASVSLCEDVQQALAGTWVHMPANLKHSIKAKIPVVMVLVLLK